MTITQAQIDKQIEELPSSLLEESAWCIIASGFASECEDSDSEFYEMESMSQCEIVSATRDLFSSLPKERWEPLLETVIEKEVKPKLEAIAKAWHPHLTLAQACEESEDALVAEVYGGGISFWDDYDYRAFGFKSRPDTRDYREPTEVAYPFLVLYKDHQDSGGFTFTAKKAWLYAAEHGSYITSRDSGACMYGFSESFLPQSEQHRQACIKWMQDHKCWLENNPEDSDSDDLAKIDAWIRFLESRPLEASNG